MLSTSEEVRKKMWKYTLRQLFTERYVNIRTHEEFIHLFRKKGRGREEFLFINVNNIKRVIIER